MNKRLIGISGLAGVGKDTTADILVEEFGFVKISLADPIKRAAMEWWDFSEETLWGPSELRNKPDERYQVGIGTDIDPPDELGISNARFVSSYLIPRTALQQIGTECARAVDKQVWVRYCLRTANKILDKPNKMTYYRTVGAIKVDNVDPPTQGVAIADCRFSNEIKAVRQAGGLVIRIKRGSTTLSGKSAQHASEAEQKSIPDTAFDYVIENYGTLEEFKDKVRQLATSLNLSAMEPQQLSFNW